MHLVAAGGVFSGNLEAALAVADFADRRNRRKLVHDRAEALQEFQVLRLVLVVEMFLIVVGVHGRAVWALRRSGASAGLSRSFLSWK